MHIAAWPFNGEYTGGPEPYSVSREANEVTASRAYALEGGVFVLCTNQPLSAAGAKLNSEGQAGASKGSFMLGGGGGCASVFGPDGRQLTEATDPHFDGLVYCDIDLDQIDYAKHLTDPVGHYSRPDLLRLLVDDEPKHFVVRVNPDGPTGTSYPAADSGRTLLSTHQSLDVLLAEESK